jgi:hemerythrin superfamily protein
MADALELLARDHHRVTAIYDQLAHTDERARRTRLTGELITVLSAHMRVEEDVFYPAVAERAEEGAGFVESNREEHEETRDCLAKLGSMPADDPRFDPTLGEMMKKVRAHVAAEELQLFPRARVSFSAAELQALGRRISRAAGATTKGRAAGATRPLGQ